MSIINFGSLNIDDVYAVDHIVRPGETLAATRQQTFPGGKGNNQSIALGRAGAAVAHVGKVGPDGLWLLPLLEQAGVDTRGIMEGPEATGRAIIQVDALGQNSIVLFPGANKTLGHQDILAALRTGRTGDWVLTQNETSGVPFLLSEARAANLRVAFNPAPMGPEVLDYPLEAVNLLVVNETEAAALARKDGSPLDLLGALAERYPFLEVLMTLGGDGALFQSPAEGRLRVEGLAVEVVDTTAAGDTFLGYFLACRQRGLDTRTCLETANRAASIAVTRPGAASSIPFWREVPSPKR